MQNTYMQVFLRLYQAWKAFQYRPKTSEGNKLLPRRLFGIFGGTESEHTL